MPTKVDSYQCDICKTYFIDNSDAVDCEKCHTEYDKLKLSSVYYKSTQEFPQAIIVTNGSDNAGLYVLNMESDTENIYESFHTIINNHQQKDY